MSEYLEKKSNYNHAQKTNGFVVHNVDELSKDNSYKKSKMSYVHGFVITNVDKFSEINSYEKNNMSTVRGFVVTNVDESTYPKDDNNITYTVRNLGELSDNSLDDDMKRFSGTIVENKTQLPDINKNVSELIRNDSDAETLSSYNSSDFNNVNIMSSTKIEMVPKTTQELIAKFEEMELMTTSFHNRLLQHLNNLKTGLLKEVQNVGLSKILQGKYVKNSVDLIFRPVRISFFNCLQFR